MVEEIAEREQPTSKRTRERSSIEFPYGDLNDAISIAQNIHDRFGARCSKDQLAATLGHDNVQSGTFQSKLATARLFGLIEIVRSEIDMTQLGRQIVDPHTSNTAKTEAFLKIPLYSSIYNQYKGYKLPPDVGLQQDMLVLGVAPKQISKARQAFQRSADQAGFFGSGRDRLVMPSLSQKPETKPLDLHEPRRQRTNGGGGGGDEPEMHPFIRGLLESLPKPGTAWPTEKRKTWLQTAENIFALIYTNEAE